MHCIFIYYILNYILNVSAAKRNACPPPPFFQFELSYIFIIFLVYCSAVNGEQVQILLSFLVSSRSYLSPHLAGNYCGWEPVRVQQQGTDNETAPIPDNLGNVANFQDPWLLATLSGSTFILIPANCPAWDTVRVPRSGHRPTCLVTIFREEGGGTIYRSEFIPWGTEVLRSLLNRGIKSAVIHYDNNTN